MTFKFTCGLAMMLATAIAAGEPDAETIARYRSTFLQRFSARAKTRELGISPAAAQVADLILDFHRNKQSSQQPGTAAHHRGTAHLERQHTERDATVTVAYAIMKLESATAPRADLETLLAVVLTPDFPTKAKVPGEMAIIFERYRVLLVAELSTLAPSKNKTTNAKAATLLLNAFESAAPEQCMALGQALAALNDEPTTNTLIKKLAPITDQLRRSTILQTLAASKNNPAQQFVTQTLTNGSAEDQAAVLSGISSDAGNAMLNKVSAAIADSKPEQVVLAAVSALERHKTEAARERLEAAFDTIHKEGIKYSTACALTRLGSVKAVSYLKSRQEQWQNDPQRSGMASYIKDLLARVQ